MSEIETIMRKVARDILPVSARRFSYQQIGKETGQNMLGYNVDKKPFIGKVVFMNEVYLVLKDPKKAIFAYSFINELDNLDFEVGDTVCLTPYARRRHDGTFLYQPSRAEPNILIVGDTKSYIPVDKTGFRSSYLAELVTQLEGVKTSDKRRTAYQVVLDNGGINQEVRLVDPSDTDCVETPPSVIFTLTANNEVHYLVVRYLRGEDAYTVHLENKDGICFSENGYVLFPDLADTMVAALGENEGFGLVRTHVVSKVKKTKTA